MSITHKIYDNDNTVCYYGSHSSASTSGEFVPTFQEIWTHLGRNLGKSTIFHGLFPRFVPRCVQIPKNLGTNSLKVKALSHGEVAVHYRHKAPIY